MNAQQSDEALVQLIAQHNAEAFAVLHDRHAQTVYSLIMRIVRDPAVADELLQETFWQVWRKANQFEGSGSAAAWLCRIARNNSLSELRRRKSRPQPSHHIKAEDQQRMLDTITAKNANVENIAARAYRRRRVREALTQLPNEQQTCLELAYFEGLSQREIAEQLQIPLGTVKTRVRLAISKLEHLLADASNTAEGAQL